MNVTARRLISLSALFGSLETILPTIEEPEKPINTSPASIYISAGGDSVRIRLPGEAAAATVAAAQQLLLSAKGSP